MNQQQLAILSRLGKCQEGKDFLNDVLKPMLYDNHMDLLKEGKANRDEIIGFGNCIYHLIEVIEKCDDKLRKQQETNSPDRI